MSVTSIEILRWTPTNEFIGTGFTRVTALNGNTIKITDTEATVAGQQFIGVHPEAQTQDYPLAGGFWFRYPITSSTFVIMNTVSMSHVLTKSNMSQNRNWFVPLSVAQDMECGFTLGRLPDPVACNRTERKGYDYKDRCYQIVFDTYHPEDPRQIWQWKPGDVDRIQNVKTGEVLKCLSFGQYSVLFAGTDLGMKDEGFSFESIQGLGVPAVPFFGESEYIPVLAKQTDFTPMVLFASTKKLSIGEYLPAALSAPDFDMDGRQYTFINAKTTPLKTRVVPRGLVYVTPIFSPLELVNTYHFPANYTWKVTDSYYCCWYLRSSFLPADSTDVSNIDTVVSRIYGFKSYCDGKSGDSIYKEENLNKWRLLMKDSGICNGGDRNGDSWFISGCDITPTTDPNYSIIAKKRASLSKDWNKDRAPSTSLAEQEYVKNTIKTDWCALLPNKLKEQCKCINRDYYSDYADMKNAGLAAEDYCWWSACNGSSDKYLRVELAPYEYGKTNVHCPANLCPSILQVINSKNVKLQNVQLNTVCNNDGTTQPEQPSKIDDKPTNGDISGDNSSKIGGVLIGVGGVCAITVALTTLLLVFVDKR